MTWTPPPRSDWVAHINALGDGQLDGGTSLLPLDAESMMAEACLATGLDDYGDAWFIEPLQVLIKSLNNEANLTTVGRLIARSTISRTLQYRLKIEDEISRHPEILEQEVAPVHAVTGLGRTGTSILHELLTLDTDNRVPMQWEMMYPVPAPETSSFQTDERILKADLEIRYMEQIIPAVRTMHENAGNLPNECIFLFAYTFASDMFSGLYSLPSYEIWMSTTDLTPAYAYHKRMLQFLQWKHPKSRWVLKAPNHLSRLPYLFSTYSNVKVAVTHRDPLRVLASITNLVSTLKYLHSDSINYDADLQRINYGSAYLCQMMVQQRKSSAFPADQIVDILYADLMADPVAVVKSLYEQWEIPFSDDFADCIKNYLASKPKGKHGVHNYSFDDTGLQLEEEREKFREYQNFFDVPSEV